MHIVKVRLLITILNFVGLKYVAIIDRGINEPAKSSYCSSFHI